MREKLHRLEKKIIPPDPLLPVYIFIEQENGYLDTDSNEFLSKKEYKKFCEKEVDVITVVGVSPEKI